MPSPDQLPDEEGQTYTDEQVYLRLKEEWRQARRAKVRQTVVAVNTALRISIEYIRMCYRRLDECCRRLDEHLKRRAEQPLPDLVEPEPEPQKPRIPLMVGISLCLCIVCGYLSIFILVGSGGRNNFAMPTTRHRSDLPMSYDEFREGNDFLNRKNDQGYSDVQVSHELNRELQRRGEPPIRPYDW